jgi:pantothenate kinase
MPDDIDTKLIDKRVVQRYLKKGRVDEKDYERHLKALPDLAEHAVAIEAALDSEALDDEDEDDEAEEGPAKES